MTASSGTRAAAATTRPRRPPACWCSGLLATAPATRRSRRSISSRAAYWNTNRAIIERGHCLRIIENGEVLFKAEIGSVALGACQVQGVWIDPRQRGRGLAAPAMAAVVAYAREHFAPVVSLYVNSYNVQALATYRRVGFTQRATFSTILL